MGYFIYFVKIGSNLSNRYVVVFEWELRLL